MATVLVHARASKTRIRYRVLYRVGGRKTPLLSAGTFDTEAEAARVAAGVRSAIAAGAVPRADSRREEHVYIAEFGGLIKIGVSVDPERRCRELHATMLACMPGGRALERELHLRFAADRVRGEWFATSEALLEFLSFYRKPTVAQRPVEAVSPRKEMERSAC